eukprot:GDKK01065699.1.p1 GENE.GDKK01065699.1~~GDKK01065699.1.p1  ORF type:complete len:103 (-),score=17.77 GDKK01065699.1:22-330(-)
MMLVLKIRSRLNTRLKQKIKKRKKKLLFPGRKKRKEKGMCSPLWTASLCCPHPCCCVIHCEPFVDLEGVSNLSVTAEGIYFHPENALSGDEEEEGRNSRQPF